LSRNVGAIFNYIREKYNEKLHNLYSSLNIMRVSKWRAIRWAGNVANMGHSRMINAHEIFVGRPNGKDYLGDMDVGRCGLNSSGSG
jgi:hypothetical protein